MRGDLTDGEWAIIDNLLQPERGRWSCPALSMFHLRLINQNGAPIRRKIKGKRNNPGQLTFFTVGSSHTKAAPTHLRMEGGKVQMSMMSLTIRRILILRDMAGLQLPFLKQINSSKEKELSVIARFMLSALLIAL